MSPPKKMKRKLSTATPSDLKVVDLRSDTLSRPMDGMREAIFSAEVGDAVFGEDPTLKILEKKAANIFHKEAACFVSSGTMSNLVAILIHCEKRCSEIITGSKSHILMFEQVGAAQVGGVNIREIENSPDGTFDIQQLKTKIRDPNNVHLPVTRLICIENTHNVLGGKVIPMEWIDELSDFAKSRNIPVHMDGARIFNAAVKLNLPVHKITEKMDTVSVCMSKSLGAPYGSILLGNSEFVSKARRAVKVLGGAVRQIGFMAAAACYALDNMVNRLQDDHNRIQRIANAIRKLKNPNVSVPDAHEIHTNILMITLNASKIATEEFISKLSSVSDTERNPVVVKALTVDEGTVRLIVYCNISDSDVENAIRKICYVINEYK